MTSHAPYYVTLRRFAQAGSVGVALVGIVVLLGWILDADLLKSGLPGLEQMKANTAIAFLAAGIALRALHSAIPALRQVALVLAILVASLGGLNLLETFFTLNLGIDELLFSDPDALTAWHKGAPGRMAVTTALSFLLIGTGLAALAASRRGRVFERAHWFAHPPLFIATVILVGYAYGVRSLFQIGPLVPMAPNTALTFFVLALSVLTLNPTRGIAKVFVSDTAGGLVARRLLPTLPLVVFGLSWALFAGERAGYYDTGFGHALMVVLSISITGLAVADTARRLHAVDRRRREAEAGLIALNAELEQRVLARTEELARSLAQVKQLDGLLPICAWCKKIRDDQDYWHSVEQYVQAHTDAHFSHGICPECEEKLEQTEKVGT